MASAELFVIIIFHVRPREQLQMKVGSDQSSTRLKADIASSCFHPTESGPGRNPLPVQPTYVLVRPYEGKR
jgi:hypothetical protein